MRPPVFAENKVPSERIVEFLMIIKALSSATAALCVVRAKIFSKVFSSPALSARAIVIIGGCVFA